MSTVEEKKQKTQVFAVIETGGKQYKVVEGDEIMIEKLGGEYNEGDKIAFDRVLLVDNGKDTTLGDPYIGGARVEGSFLEEGKQKKIRVLRFKSKSRHLKQKGHRQPFSKIKIEKIG